MKPVDETDLIITRKRKKYKFAYFDSFENSFSFPRGADPEELKIHLRTYLPDTQPLVLELGAGKASFSLELARQNPDINFVAVDVKSDRLYSGAKHALQEGAKNIAFIRMHMNELDRVFDQKSIKTIWITFPDPHPKKRSAKHRLTHPDFLKKYQRLLARNGAIKFKTDNRELFSWSLEQFVSGKWQINELSFDLHESDLPNEYKIMTEYEQRYTREKKPINFAVVTKR